MIDDVQEYLQEWEKINNPFYPDEMRWNRLKVNEMLRDYKKQGQSLPIDIVIVPKGTVCNHEWTQWKAEGETLDGCTKCGLIEKQTAL